MQARLAINGYGRIGQCILRAWAEREDCRSLQLVALNELSDLETLAYLTRYDTIHGRFPGTVAIKNNQLWVHNQPIEVFSSPTAAGLPWHDLGVDLLLECTGSFTSRSQAEEHLSAGCKRLLFSHPAEADVDATLICGVNLHQLSADMRIVSAASCTTNCVIPVLKLIDDYFGIEKATTTTIHSAMNDQPVSDAYNKSDLRLARSAMASIIPVSTGLAKGICRIMPHLEGKLACSHLRVPTLNVSAMDLTLQVRRPTSAAEVNQLLYTASQGALQGIMGYTQEPNASVDFNHDPRSSIVDASQTQVAGQHLIKLLCWFDNEWGFANRMLDIARHWLQLPPNSAP